MLPAESRTRVILGPVPCQGCRLMVTWNRFEWQRGSQKHDCGPLTVKGRMALQQSRAVKTSTAGQGTRHP